MVMRVRDHVYHLQCFRCAWCNAPLESGDFFGLRDNLVYCQQHYDGAMAYEAPPLPLYGPPFEAPPPPQGRKGRPRKKKQAEQDMQKHVQGLSPIDPSGLSVHMGHLDGGARTPPPLSSSGQRMKRMRTSFKHHQLRAMKAFFNENQNPDAKELKKLASRTGLTKRVLQVWFQNARAKWRRNNNNNKQNPGQQGGMMGSEHSPNSQLHPMGLLGNELCSPDGVSSYSESSPVHSCGGVPSDGSLSTHVGQGQSMDFDSSNPLTPIINHHGHNPIHNGDPIMHMTSFQNLF
ncbi:hypothetical protein CDAR_93841 [Caerostris darwini]|uniref:Uncharacterized protein n=1 Tax=Caerostris darwini TaxID=1538125 RepID=A0AAV4NL66_9ARAC|nr:hypothetical protein CDAR_93841 [Caerostris darwini]